MDKKRCESLLIFRSDLCNGNLENLKVVIIKIKVMKKLITAAIVAAISLNSCEIPTNNEINKILSTTGDKYEKVEIEGHQYLVYEEGLIDSKHSRMSHDGNCPKCRKELIHIVDSIIKSNIKE